jgi:hypothetical protein
MMTSLAEKMVDARLLDQRKTVFFIFMIRRILQMQRPSMKELLNTSYDKWKR